MPVLVLACTSYHTRRWLSCVATGCLWAEFWKLILHWLFLVFSSDWTLLFSNKKHYILIFILERKGGDYKVPWDSVSAQWIAFPCQGKHLQYVMSGQSFALQTSFITAAPGHRLWWDFVSGRNPGSPPAPPILTEKQRMMDFRGPGQNRHTGSAISSGKVKYPWQPGKWWV